jgi:hypothetical protein
VIHLTHDEAIALWNFFTENVWDEIGIFLGLGTKTASYFADGLRNRGLGRAILAEIVERLAATGLTLIEIIAIITTLSYTLYQADYWYGNKGVDIILDPRIPVPIIVPPTIEHQHGTWHYGEQYCKDLSIFCPIDVVLQPDHKQSGVD